MMPGRSRGGTDGMRRRVAKQTGDDTCRRDGDGDGALGSCNREERERWCLMKRGGVWLETMLWHCLLSRNSELFGLFHGVGT